MSDNIDIDEIQLLLGINNKGKEIEEILSNNKKYTLLSAISEILCKLYIIYNS